MLHYAWVPWRKAFTISGRARRKEYWAYMLTLVLGLIGFMAADHNLGLVKPGRTIGPLAFGFLLLSMPATICCQVRRLHDQNLPGKAFFKMLIPWVGEVNHLDFMTAPGTIGPNDYGADPKPDMPPEI